MPRSRAALGTVESDLSTFEDQFAPARRVQAGQHFHQGRFAGAVVPDHAENLAGPQVQIDVAQRRYGAKILGDASGFQKRRRVLWVFRQHSSINP